MNTASCGTCGVVMPADQIELTVVGAYCRQCLVTETADSERLERELLRSTGRRQVIAGVIMLAFGITILSLGISGGAIVLVPTGILVGGLFELVQGATKL